MKRQPTRPLLLGFLLALVLTSCADLNPGPAATLAPTAAPAGTEANLSETAMATENTPMATAEAPPDAPASTAPAALNATASAATEVAYAAIVAAQATPSPTATTAATATPEPSPTPAPPPTYSYEVIATYPHDPEAFTQGLVFHDGGLYEGTGRWGESTLREVALESGAVLRSRALEDQYFGEGITLFNDKIFQLTWQEQTGFVYDRATFEPLQSFTYPHEGWGITHDEARLIVSDGTATIRYWDPATLQEIGRVSVRDDQGPVNRLNELEYVDGEIWANIWLTDRIARISPETGDVVGYIDLTGLLDTSKLTQPADVLNGIAYDPATGRLFVTGKLWPSLFEIRVIPAP